MDPPTVPDQADKLRQLVQESSRQPAEGAHVPLIVICGGQHGVGTSTLVLQLALGCQRRKLKVLLVDASFPEVCYHLPPRGGRRETLVDVLSGGRTVSEAIQSGPHGLHVLPGAELPAALADISSPNWGRVIGQLRSLQAAADLILVDGGTGVSARMAPLWQIADLVLLVAGPEPVGAVDAYAVLKAASARIDLPRVGVLVNRVREREDGQAASERIAAAADRFLGLELEVNPPIPLFTELAGQATAPRRLLKDAALRAAFEDLADRVWQQIQTRPSSGIEARRAA